MVSKVFGANTCVWVLIIAFTGKLLVLEFSTSRSYVNDLTLHVASSFVFLSSVHILFKISFYFLLILADDDSNTIITSPCSLLLDLSLS